MQEVSELRVTQIRLYSVDRIPYQALLIAKNLTALQGIFHFKAFGPAEGQESPGVAFNIGDFTHEGKDHLIDRLLIQPQRIVVIAGAPSSVCNAFHSALESFLAKIDPFARFSSLPPVFCTEETICAVDLDIEFQDLFSPGFNNFLARELQSAVTSSALKVSILPSRVAVKISYGLTDPDLATAGYSIADKVMAIEPRVHTVPSDRRYMAISPTDSETHLRLLEALERAIK